MDKKVIFVHGYTSSSNKDWYPTIAPKLTKLGVDFSIPDLPGGYFPQSDIWLKLIDEEVKKTEKPIIFVGHSLGTRAILLYLDKYNRRVDTVILVSAFDNDLEENNKTKLKGMTSFFESPLNIPKVKNLADKFIVMHSTDDRSIPFGQGAKIAQELEAELITYKGRGHFYKPEDYKFVLEVIGGQLGLV